MSIVAVVPVAGLLAANASLQAQGYGPENFSVPAYAGPVPTFAALHAWDDSAFVAAIKAVPGVVFDESAGDPGARTTALIEAQGARWPGQALPLPTSGNANANTLYTYNDTELWWVIQTFNRTTFPAPPATYPALIRRARVPGTVEPWVQPLDQFDAYQLVNAFTGKPDECSHQGSRWVSDYANNVWEPGVFGWTLFEETP